MQPSHISPTPASLLRRLATQADPEAWPRFVELYTPLLFSWAGRLGFAGGEAADLVQDVFAVLLVELPRFQYDATRAFRAWLWTLVRNRASDLTRAASRRPTVPLAPGDDPAGDDPLEEWAEGEYRRHLTRRLIRLMRAEFAENVWRACWLTTAEGRSVNEVAAELSMTPAAVYKARARVLERLRQELDGLLD